MKCREFESERLECRHLLAVDLVVEVDAPVSSSPGEVTSYEVRVKNTGTDTAIGVVVSDQVSDVLEEVTWRRNQVFTAESEVVDLTSDASRGIVASASLGSGLEGDLTVAGDLNGDGFDDIAFGAGGAEVDGVEVGAIYVILGSNDTWPGETFFDLNLLDGTNGFTIYGWDRGETQVIFSSDAAGDLNRDGFDDLLVEDGEGNVYLIYGRASFPPVVELLDANADDAIVKITGGLPDGFGIVTAAAAGDVNGDEIDDILLGGRSLSDETSFVLFGSTTALESEILLSDLDSSDGFRIDGAIGFGGGGDVNGDGVDDLLFGSDQSSELFVLYGSKAGLEYPTSVLDVDGDNGFVLITEFFFTGRNEVHIIGDVNADGLDDLVLPSVDRNQHAVVFGSRDFTDELHLAALEQGEGLFINLPEGGGGGVAATGDVNGDGVDDIVIGRDGEIINEIPPDPFGGQPQAEGRVYVLFGSPDLPLQVDASKVNGADGFKVNGDPKRRESGFGISVANGADANGDGVHDVLIGAPFFKGGRAYIVYGRASYGGTGPLADVANIAAGETVSYVVTGIVMEGAPNGFTSGRATATISAGQEDVNEANNSADYVYTIGLPGDIDGDGKVAFGDFLILSSNFGTSEGAVLADGDLDGDGRVLFSDFLIISQNFGRSL